MKEPDYVIRSGGGDLFHPGLSKDAAKDLCDLLTVSSRPLSPVAETIRKELARGTYQMPGDNLPYETQAARIAAILAAGGLLS